MRAASQGTLILSPLLPPIVSSNIPPDGPALLILAVLTANVRNCALPSSKAKALDVFLALSPHLTDEAKLDRMVPYIVELLHDDGALVRAAALRTLIQVVRSLSSLPIFMISLTDE